MASYTIYSGSGGGYIRSANNTYSTARAGSSLTATTGAGEAHAWGQERSGSSRRCYEAFFAFDCSSVTGTASVATFSEYGLLDASTTDFTMEARTKTWSGSGLTTADWVAGASLSGLTLLASRSSSGWSTSGYNAWTSEAALLTAVDLHGSLEFLTCSAEQTSGSDPTNDEYVGCYNSEESGTSTDPKLEITSDVAGQPYIKRTGGVPWMAGGYRTPQNGMVW